MMITNDVSCSYSILQVVQGYKHWRNVKLIFHKAPQEKVEGGQIWRSRRPGSGPPSVD